MEKSWSELSKEEKREQRLKDYISPIGVEFRDAKAENVQTVLQSRACLLSPRASVDQRERADGVRGEINVDRPHRKGCGDDDLI